MKSSVPILRQRSNMGSRIDAQRPVLGIKGWVSAEADAGYHHHPRGQLAYAAEGMLKVFTQAGSWVIPSTQAVWIPGEMEHAVNAEIDAEIRHIFIDPSCLDRLPHECSIVEMSSLLRELIMRVADYGTDYELEGPASRVCAVILDELQGLKPSLLHLPGAKDRRLQRVMKAMIEAPSAETGLDHWARYAGASERTLARLFSRETGMSFQKWRKQLLLQEAVFRLGRGESVLDVSLELGYRSPSAFVAMFRKALGKPPGQYFKERA